MMYQSNEWVTSLIGCKWISRTLLKFSILMFWDLSFASFASLLHHMNVPWLLEALDAPDVTFISRRADISGEYTFAGAQMLCKRWCGDSSDHWKIIGFPNHPAWWKHVIAYEDPHLIRNNQRQVSCCNCMHMDPNWGTNRTHSISPFIFSQSFCHLIFSILLNSSHFSQRFPHVFPQFHPVSGVSEGYPYYSNGDMLIRYHHEGRKWLVAGTEHKGNNCIAYAEAQETMHPGYGFLRPGGTDGDEILGMFMMGKNPRQKNGECVGKIWSLLIDELARLAPFFVDKTKCGGKRVEFAWSVLQLRFNAKNFRSLDKRCEHNTFLLGFVLFFFLFQEFVEEMACVECLHGAMECGCQLSLPCCAQHRSCAWSTSSGPSELVFTLRVEDRPVTSSWNPFINYCKARYLIIKQLPSTMYLKALKVTQHIIISLCEYITM